MRTLRDESRRLARSPLAIIVIGEPGTGARTLARSIAHHRAGSADVVDVHVERTLPYSWGAGAVLLVGHPDLASRQLQVALADSVQKKSARLVAWANIGALEHFDPQLRAILIAGVLTLPPLRERGRDAVHWAKEFLRVAAGDAASLSPACEDAIAGHDWPGNLAQLEGVVQRAVALREPGATGPLEDHDLGLGASADWLVPLAEAVDRFRNSYVRKVLERFGGNRTRAARALGIDPRTVFRYLEHD